MDIILSSVLGIGSDIGGSLRIPAHFSGIASLKVRQTCASSSGCVSLQPSTGRIYEGGRRGGVGAGARTLRTGIYSVAGFMSRTVAGVEVGMRALLADSRRMAAVDWRVAPLDWQPHLARPGRKLRIGFYLDDGIFPPTAGVTRWTEHSVYQ